MSNPKQSCKLSYFLAAGLAFGFCATSLGAAPLATGSIDRDLEQQVDFRSLDFSECFEEFSCQVNGVTVTAERRNDDDTNWVPAQLYWDPVDGLGILDGGQNDEIDFDERLLVTLDQAQPVSRIWVSDLFLGEDPRYGSSGENIAEEVLEDVEVAEIVLKVGGFELDRRLLVGEVQLPDDQFNTGVSEVFRDEGDLRRRIVINEEIISIVAPDPSALNSSVLLLTELGKIDDEKRVIFEGLETFEIDLTEILLEFHDAELFAFGTHNFEEVERRLQDRGELESMNLASQELRAVGDWDNGELAEQLPVAMTVDVIEFYAPFDASNDFSVAGLVFETEIAELATE